MIFDIKNQYLVWCFKIIPNSLIRLFVTRFWLDVIMNNNYNYNKRRPKMRYSILCSTFEEFLRALDFNWHSNGYINISHNFNDIINIWPKDEWLDALTFLFSIYNELNIYFNNF